MKKIIIIAFAFIPILVIGQITKEKAISKFELFFIDFKNAYPADQNQYSFKNYSELQIRNSIPEELEMMANYDSTSFYDQYLYHIDYLRDTLVKISDLDLNLDIKEIYSKFRQSIIEGRKNGIFNYSVDKVYSDKLKILLTKLDPPQIGYYQTAISISTSKKRKVEENKIFITYNNDLDVIGFGTIHEEK